MKKGFISTIIDDVKKRRNLPPSFHMALETIRTRVQRNSLKSFHRGTTSPLFDIEPAVVSTIIEICRIRQCLTPPQGIELVNSMIEGTEAQNKPVGFKKVNSHVPIDPSLLGRVGRGYWNGFIRRNRDKIISRHGQKYELDRAS